MRPVLTLALSTWQCQLANAALLIRAGKLIVTSFRSISEDQALTQDFHHHHHKVCGSNGLRQNRRELLRCLLESSGAWFLSNMKTVTKNNNPPLPNDCHLQSSSKKESFLAALPVPPERSHSSPSGRRNAFSMPYCLGSPSSSSFGDDLPDISGSPSAIHCQTALDFSSALF